MRTPAPFPESSLQALEELLGVKITIVDRDGAFHTAEGLSRLGRARQSHRKNLVCDSAFVPRRCIGHCRHEMNERGAGERNPFIHTCWLGICEVVVPLWKDAHHYGNLFAGAWRQGERPALPGSSAKTRALVSALPPLDEAKAQRIGEALRLSATGLLATLEESGLASAPQPGFKAQIRSWLSKHASGEASLPALAAALGRSPSRTSHLVRELFGASFRGLLLETRLSRAKSLLSTTDLSLAEVSEACGFGDAYRFNKAFKARLGEPPGRWRKKRWQPEY